MNPAAKTRCLRHNNYEHFISCAKLSISSIRRPPALLPVTKEYPKHQQTRLYPECDNNNHGRNSAVLAGPPQRHANFPLSSKNASILQSPAQPAITEQLSQKADFRAGCWKRALTAKNQSNGRSWGFRRGECISRLH
jgi:hypothetical protein